MRLVSVYYGDYYPFDSMPMITEGLCSNHPDDLKEDDILLVWGGEDISPALYNQPAGTHTGSGDHPSRRDAIEWRMMQRAKEMKVPIIGVCRGAQMLCALNGGTLFQHVNNHAGSNHVVITDDGYEFVANSLHHQMLNLEGTNHKLLAWTKDKRVTIGFEVDTFKLPEVEPEMVLFPDSRGIAIQWHPEMMGPDVPATKYALAQIESFVNGQA